VEDDPGDRWYLAELLRSRAYDVVACESAETAWIIFQEQAPPLIFLDLMLPAMDGVTLCRKIRAHPRGPEAVILAVSGRDEPKLFTGVLEAGADDFLRKPVHPAFLDIRLCVAERHVAARAAQRMTQEALAAKSREMEQLFRSLPDVFFSVDLTEERLLQISPSVERLLGHTAGALQEDRSAWRPLLFPDDGSGGAWAAVAATEPGESYEAEYEVVGADKEPRAVRVSVAVERDPGSGHLRGDGFLVDITPESDARKKLSERTEELAALYRVSELTLTSEPPESAYGPILAEIARAMDVPMALLEHLDRARDRLVVSAAHGARTEDLVGRAIPVDQTLSGVAVQTGEPLIVADARERRELRDEALLALEPRGWASFPLSAGGAVSGTLTLLDTRARPLKPRWVHAGSSLATTLAAFMERLEAGEALRASEARHRLLAARLQEANDELESFAYSVSHDLRAPLRTMQGFAHALLQNHGAELSTEARDYVRRIIASGRQSERLIGDLLAYSRLSFEQLDLASVDLEAVVDQALTLVGADVEEAGARVQVRVDDGRVLGSHAVMVQVVSNLLSNAVKFVPGDRVAEVRVRTEESGDRVRLWVEDNGIGVPPGQEERIFRVFERLDEGGDRPGTGIGLAIVRRGMQRMGGACGVQRPREGGSAFWIEMTGERRQEPRSPSRRRRT
jgi:signal transduction histidine kinase/DNA-binding NarL/FixJ family response regulator